MVVATRRIEAGQVVGEYGGKLRKPAAHTSNHTILCKKFAKKLRPHLRPSNKQLTK